MSRRELPLLDLVTLLGCLMICFASSTIRGQPPGGTEPTVGIRENPPDSVFLKNARIVVRPGQILESASVFIRGSSIIAVGENIDRPAGAEKIDLTGKTIYAGFIDGFGEIDVDEPPTSGVGHWNGYVLPRRAASTEINSVSNLSAFRSQGITLRVIAPRGAIVKGSSALVMLDGNTRASLVDDNVAQHLQLTVPRDKRRDEYPNSPMGAVALLRQTLSDADWYNRAWNAYRSKPLLPRPDRNDDLLRLSRDMRDGRFVVDAPNERMAIRADKLASEFSLDIAFRGSGREYRDLAGISATGRTILVPVDFPDAPDVSSEAQAADVELRELMHWHFAPENPARLSSAGVAICLTTDGLDDPKKFLKNVRRAVKRGLSPDAALAALTTAPATWLGMEKVFGQVHAGALANLVITDGDVFDEKTRILETWVSGKRFRHASAAEPSPDALAGRWKTSLRIDSKTFPVKLQLERDKAKWTGKLMSDSEDPQTKDEQSPDEKKDKKQRHAEWKKIARAVDRLTAWVDLSHADGRFPAGPSRITLITVPDSDPLTIFSSITLPDGKQQELRWKKSPPDESTKEKDTNDKVTDTDEQSTDTANDPSDSESTDSDESLSDSSDPLDQISINYPLGGRGVVGPIETAPAVIFRNATIWTCADAGVLEMADVLIVNGKIGAVGKSIEPPQGCRIIDANGKHLTPGLIDCHTHMGTDGGVNESGQAVTAEVRVGDFVDNSDMNIYRQLAGGLTCSNILHGSANPIGGQNQVIKLRWGDSMDGMKMSEAPQGIKFALGENVKRSNRSEPQTRYPASRMGVEQLFRDRFHAAEEYARRHQRWREGKHDGLPPRRDYELDAIAEILDGKRWIHCHSYRQDEIVALLDLLDKFEITIGTLQHILEGYKVADRMLEHGAMASAFSDWWAYKFEVYDAIPYNGAIMHDVGIVVSFNSDDRELARHLNTEAAKAMKYGGVPAEEALKFVTLNPAKQLRIDDHVGSIEIGKDADVVLWSGPPLSTLSRCEQTWVDGRPMFTIESDQQLRDRDAQWRSILIAKILDENFGSSSVEQPIIDEEDRWLRYDEFCHGHDDQKLDEHAGHNHAGYIDAEVLK